MRLTGVHLCQGSKKVRSRGVAHRWTSIGFGRPLDVPWMSLAGVRTKRGSTGALDIHGSKNGTRNGRQGGVGSAGTKCEKEI